jgi:hypothetical protein
MYTRRSSIPVPEGLYACTRCREGKPKSAFSIASKNGKVSSICLACKMAANGEWIQRNASRPIEDFADKFWEKVDSSKVGTGCREWTAATNNKGYGHMWTNKPSPELAHHIAMRLAGLKVPSKEETDECVDHMCRNPRCVALSHLRVVTQFVNAVENNDSPLAKNHHKTECARGHPYIPENIAIRRFRGPKGSPTLGRICLTCVPSAWRYAVVKRDPPPGAQIKRFGGWVGPETRQRTCS